jgi:hypothetical protein
MLASAIDSTNAKKSPSRLVSDSGVIEVPGLIPSPAALWVEDIAHSPYGMDQLLIEGIIHLDLRRRIATSTTLVSVSKLTSQTWDAIVVRDSTSPLRRMSRCNSENS